MLTEFGCKTLTVVKAIAGSDVTNGSLHVSFKKRLISDSNSAALQNKDPH